MKTITIQVTEDQYWYLHRAISNDWEDETDDIGEKTYFTAEAKKENAFRRRLQNRLIKQFNKQS